MREHNSSRVQDILYQFLLVFELVHSHLLRNSIESPSGYSQETSLF